MSDIFVAVGLILAIEGLLYALFPDLMKRMAAQVSGSTPDPLRMAGVASLALGVLVVWLARR